MARKTSSRTRRSSSRRRPKTTRQTLINQLGRAIALLIVLGLVLLLNRYCGMESELIGPGAKITAVDGDSLRTASGEEYRIFAIDAPELNQTCTNAKGKEWDCGRAAKRELAKLIRGGEVSCIEKATDKYSRNIAQCSAKGVPDVGEAMVREGLAIDLGRQTNYTYAGAESEARAQSKGMWAGTFQRPGEWRTQNPRTD
ncbi:MAG: thermonuclease family protein [Pseudomonadota bacterium]